MLVVIYTIHTKRVVTVLYLTLHQEGDIAFSHWQFILCQYAAEIEEDLSKEKTNLNVERLTVHVWNATRIRAVMILWRHRSYTGYAAYDWLRQAGQIKGRQRSSL